MKLIQMNTKSSSKHSISDFPMISPNDLLISQLYIDMTTVNPSKKVGANGYQNPTQQKLQHKKPQLSNNRDIKAIFQTKCSRVYVIIIARNPPYQKSPNNAKRTYRSRPTFQKTQTNTQSTLLYNIPTVRPMSAIFPPQKHSTNTERHSSTKQQTWPNTKKHTRTDSLLSLKIYAHYMINKNKKQKDKQQKTIKNK